MPAVVERVSCGMRERSERKDGGRGMRQMTESGRGGKGGLSVASGVLIFFLFHNIIREGARKWDGTEVR